MKSKMDEMERNVFEAGKVYYPANDEERKAWEQKVEKGFAGYLHGGYHLKQVLARKERKHLKKHLKEGKIPEDHLSDLVEILERYNNKLSEEDRKLMEPLIAQMKKTREKGKIYCISKNGLVEMNDREAPEPRVKIR